MLSSPLSPPLFQSDLAPSPTTHPTARGPAHRSHHRSPTSSPTTPIARSYPPTQRASPLPLRRYFLLFLICLNTLIMMVERDPMPLEQRLFVEHANMLFTAIYALEMILKILGKGLFNYWRDPFDRFDGEPRCHLRFLCPFFFLLSALLALPSLYFSLPPFRSPSLLL